MFLEELKNRELLGPCIGDVEKHLKEKRTGYVGFDPTYDSLTIGHLSIINVMKHFANSGHFPIILLGGCTAQVGDPSGKEGERELLNAVKIMDNVEKLSVSIEKFLPDVYIVNNEKWLDNMNLITFLRECKSFSVNELLNRSFVSRRLETGISYTEFSYSILQAYDFVHLKHTTDATIQFGGEDQIGNIVSGISYGKKQGLELFGITCPLLLDRNGKKFGKTEEGSIYLSKERTSPYKFWQFLFNTEDTNVISCLKKFTFLPLKDIEEIEQEHKKSPGDKKAHKILADEVTSYVHSKNEVEDINTTNKCLFEKSIEALEDKEIVVIKRTIGFIEKFYTSKEEMLVESGVAKSKREARTLIEQKGVQIKENGDYLFIRRGKHDWKLVEKCNSKV